jgi:hypothetical protein
MKPTEYDHMYNLRANHVKYSCHKMAADCRWTGRFPGQLQLAAESCK